MSRALAAYAEREAVVIGDERLTYAELADRIGRLAAGLHQLGIGKGDVVVLLLPTCLEFVYLYWALGQVGRRRAPVNPLSRRAEIGHILARLRGDSRRLLRRTCRAISCCQSRGSPRRGRPAQPEAPDRARRRRA